MAVLNTLTQFTLNCARVGTQSAYLAAKLVCEATIAADATMLYAKNKARRKLEPDHILNDAFADKTWRQTYASHHKMDANVSKIIDGSMNIEELINEALKDSLNWDSTFTTMTEENIAPAI